MYFICTYFFTFNTLTFSEEGAWLIMNSEHRYLIETSLIKVLVYFNIQVITDIRF